jgi:hypothetical protein
LAKCECTTNTFGNPTVACLPSTPAIEPSLAAGCSNNDDCPEYTACENLQCVNPCAQNDPCAAQATCRVITHKVVCTCPNGYIGSPQTSCHPREYRHKVNQILQLFCQCYLNMSFPQFSREKWKWQLQ